MPFGLPNVAAPFQRHLRSILAAQEAMHQATMSEVAMDPPKPPGPPEPRKVQDLGGS